MTTKDQERKALEQIRKIVEGLGEDSYIGTAFAGVLEDAETNIEWDAAFSMKDRYEAAERNEKLLREGLADTEKRLETAKKAANERIEELTAEIEELKERIKQLRDDKFKAEKDAIDERKDVTVGTTDGQEECKPFSKIQFFNNDGFRFINIVEKSGWTNSYRIDDLTKLVIE